MSTPFLKELLDRHAAACDFKQPHDPAHANEASIEAAMAELGEGRCGGEKYIALHFPIDEAQPQVAHNGGRSWFGKPILSSRGRRDRPQSGQLTQENQDDETACVPQ